MITVRLWHEDILDKLPTNQFNGQHRELAALRGAGWGKKHATVDYIFDYPIEHLIVYHFRYLKLRRERGYNYNKKWEQASYRGKKCDKLEDVDFGLINKLLTSGKKCYKEHDNKYLQENINNLMEKGAVCRYYENYLRNRR